MSKARPRPRQAALIAPTGPKGFPFSAKKRPDSPSAVQQRILTSTEELLRSTSFADLTVADILQAAGVSRTTFYRYFTSKELVVSSILKGLHADFADGMRPWFHRGDRSPEESLREAVTGAARQWEQQRQLMRACSENWHAAPEIGQAYAALMETYVDDVSGQIDRERRTGAAPQGVDSRDLALYLAWGTERMFYLAGFGMFGPGLELDSVESVVAVWLGAIYKI